MHSNKKKSEKVCLQDGPAMPKKMLGEFENLNEKLLRRRIWKAKSENYEIYRVKSFAR